MKALYPGLPSTRATATNDLFAKNIAAVLPSVMSIAGCQEIGRGDHRKDIPKVWSETESHAGNLIARRLSAHADQEEEVQEYD
jgi:hypothetical protein